MPKSYPSKSKQTKPDSNITAARIGIIAAVITLVGTVATAIFSYMSVRAPIELSIQATQTADAKTLAPVSASGTKPGLVATTTNNATPAPTKNVSSTTVVVPASLTPTTTNLLTIGQDLKSKCISDKIWIPYSSLQTNQNRESKNGCWQLVELGLAAEADGLLITRQTAKEKGMFGIVAPISETAVIEVTVKVEKLYNAVLKFGVLSGTAPDKKMKGAIFALYDEGGIVLRKLDNNEETIVDQALIPCYPGVYSFRFEITKIRLNTVRYGGICNDGTDISKAVSYQTVDIDFINRNFFIGYESQIGSGLDVKILNLSAQSK